MKVFLDVGKIPYQLTSNKEVCQIIWKDPLISWKALNHRQGSLTGCTYGRQVQPMPVEFEPAGDLSVLAAYPIVFELPSQLPQ